MIPLNDKDRPALLVVDMQCDGVRSDGAIPAEDAELLIPSIRTLAVDARAKGWPVVHTQHVHRSDLSDFGIAELFEPPSCVEGTPGMDIVPELAPEPGDLLVQKRRYDAFFATDLDLLLRGLGVTGLITCGILTDVCVLATVTHARSLDYKVWLVSDALAGLTRQRHGNALDLMSKFFADVWTTDQVVACRP